jgi:hypothetical protein
MLKHILEAIFENNFMYYSYGFRPYRNSHLAIRKLDYEVMKRPVNYMVGSAKREDEWALQLLWNKRESSMLRPVL